MSKEEQEHRPTPSPEPSQNQPAYVSAARFSGERPAGRAYRQAQDLLFATPDCELSAYRFHLDRVWHVAVLGDQPPEDLERQLQTILSRGEPASLPEEVLIQLQRRRAQATKLGPWIEGHYHPGRRFPEKPPTLPQLVRVSLHACMQACTHARTGEYGRSAGLTSRGCLSRLGGVSVIS